MKTHFCLLAFGAALAAAATGFGQPPPPAPPPEPPPAPPHTLHVLISAPLQGGALGNLYNRVAADYGAVFRHRRWPLAISLEEFGGGPIHDRLELQVFVERIRQWLPDELTYAAWTTLTIDGRKYDLGIIQYVYQRRAHEEPDISLDNAVKGGALATAAKIEPLLFPKNR